MFTFNYFNYLYIMSKISSFYDITLIRPPAVEAFRFATTSITLPLGLSIYIISFKKESNFKVQIIDAVGNEP